MNSKRFLRKTFLAILLVAAILLGSFSSCLTVYAVEASGDVLAELGAADTGLTVEKLVLSEDDVPEVIDFAEAQEKGHVLRLRSKESDDNTVVFLNEDNTETMYLFAESVKYTDEYGNVKDKSTALTLSDGAYTMAQNDVKVSFALDPSPDNPNNIYVENYYSYCDGRTNGGSGFVWQDVVLVAQHKIR